ncbi:hypothetical protein FNV43_RR25417 [Rhamnella rubrinervis]|uniref:F-box domain-containing protein n=1 Tax=Rhamnella rubrinervis TaxID=2594499 RepID=A0A8K0DUI7_9ROSA|nr:hypothetical protein FNV43_RR25417 [Rhamnella rubrinervis]
MSNSKRNRTSTATTRRSASADRLSDVPEYVLHRILSFMPTFDAIRMSLVSKRFRNIWFHIPVLDFPQSRTKHIDFVGFVKNCFSRRIQVSPHDDLNNLEKFMLHIDYELFDYPNTIDYWLRYVLQMGVKELDLSIKPSNNLYSAPYYCVPESLLNNSTATSLTMLKLNNVGLRTSVHTSLPSLTSLSLTDVHLEEEEEEYESGILLQNLISGCPNIECLYWGRRIKRRINFLKDPISYIDLTVCRALKILSLYCSKLADKWLEDIVFGLPLLERLALDDCYGFKKLTIRSQSLKSFYFFCDRYSDIEVTLFTPNLVYFSYKGDGGSVFLMTSPNLLGEAVVKLVATDEHRIWYLDLLLLLSNLNCFNTMKLYLPSEKALLFPKYMRKMCHSTLPDLKHLKVKIHDDFNRHRELMKALLRLAPCLQTLEIKRQSYL